MLVKSDAMLALAKGVALVMYACADGALPGITQGMWCGFGQAIAGGRFAGIEDVFGLAGLAAQGLAAPKQ